MAQPSTNPSQTGTETTPDPTATFVATTALDFLLIELVPMAYRITSDLALREEASFHSSNAPPNNLNTSTSRSQAEDATSTVGMSAGGAAGLGIAGIGLDEEEAREAVFHRLETLGYRVGLGVVERSVPSPSPFITLHYFTPDTDPAR
jgi:hypothetical protein